MQQHVMEDRTATNLVDQEQERWTIAKLWMAGYSIRDIASELGHTSTYVLAQYREARGEMLTWHEDEIAHLAAERIEGFRNIQRQANEAMEEHPRQTVALLVLVSKAEENIAKIQGLMNDKGQSISKTTRTLKTYTFTDNFPDKVVEMEQTEIHSTPALQMPIEKFHETPDMILHNGEAIEMEGATVIAVKKRG